LLGISALAAGVMCFCWTDAISTAGITGFSIIYGFTSGLLSPCCQLAFRRSLVIPTILGLTLRWACFVLLSGP
jgi:hypothetical protein